MYNQPLTCLRSAQNYVHSTKLNTAQQAGN